MTIDEVDEYLMAAQAGDRKALERLARFFAKHDVDCPALLMAADCGCQGTRCDSCLVSIEIAGLCDACNAERLESQDRVAEHSDNLLDARFTYLVRK